MTRTITETRRLPNALPATDEARGVQDYVYGTLDVLADPGSDLHQSFYGTHGVTDMPLTDVRHPFAGSTVLLANETKHMVRVGGEEYNVGTFKRRGALLAALVAMGENPSAERLVTASAGNHALGVAAAAAAMGMQTAIFCRKDISSAKKDILKGVFEAEVHPDFSELEYAMAAARDDAKRTGDVFIHPFDQLPVIAGQATIGVRIARQLEARYDLGEIDRETEVEVHAGVGGGGLITGIALGIAWAKARGKLDGNVAVVGAQMERCNAMDRALRGRPLNSLFAEKELDASCDGTAVREPGRLALAVLAHRGLVKSIRRVSKADVGAAMQSLTWELHHLVEPAGALGWAGALGDAVERRDSGESKKVYIPLVTGRNVTPERYREYVKAVKDRYQAGLDGLARRSAGSPGIPLRGRSSPSGLKVASGPTFR